jgi:hypothetical protein
MDIAMGILRLIHIFSGTFWVGTTFFFVLFFVPTLAAIGPAGGSVMGRLVLMRFPTVMAITGLLTILAGFILYLIDSGGLQVSWIVTPAGMTMTLASLVGIAAFILGMAVQVPANTRIAAIQKEIQAGGKPPTPSQLQEIKVLQGRVALATKWGATLMVISLIGMTIAREVGTLK